MNTIENIQSILFSEFAESGKLVAIHTEGNFLIIKVGTADTRIMNWESMTSQAILDIAKSLVLRENYRGNVLLHG